MVDAPEGKDVALIISEADILGGRARDRAHCIVARSGMRQLPILEIHIGAHHAYARYAATPEQWTRYVLSKDSAAKIRQFDESGAAIKGASKWLDGMTFILKAPAGSERVGLSKPTGPHLNTGKPRKVLRPMLRHAMYASVESE